MLGMTKAQTITLGVSKGDMFTYDYTVTYYTNYTGFSMMNYTNSLKCVIDDISNNYLYETETVSVENGTQHSQQHVLYMTNGSAYSEGLFSIIAPNLKAKDSVLLGSQFVINETISRTYQGATRETNQIVYNVTGNGISDYFEMNFDKTSGVLVSSYSEVPNIGYYDDSNPSKGYYEYIVISSANLKSSSLWTIPEFPSAILMITFLLAVTLIGTIAIKRKQSRR
jgi:hypothetical protein